MNKKGFTLVEVIAVVALLAILIGLAGTSFVKKYNESKLEALVIQEGQLVQSGDMVVRDYCKDPLSEGYQLQCDDYYQSYTDSNDKLIVENNLYTKYICVNDLKNLGYYSEELKYSGVDCSGVVVYKIDEDTDLQKESFSVIRCGEDYVSNVDDAESYIREFSECFDVVEGETQPPVEQVQEYTLVVNFTELTPNGMKVAQSQTKKYKRGDSVSISVPTYTTVENDFKAFKHGSSTNAGNFSLNANRTTLSGTMPSGNVTINIVYAVSTYTLTVNYKEFMDVQGNINFPTKQYTLYFGETVDIPYESKNNFKVISPASFSYQMQQEDVEIDVIYQQQDFTLTYNSNGGTNCTTRKVTYNKSFGTLCTPTRTGYTFQGWKSSSGSTVTASTINSSYNNVTLTAQWKANEYVVIYNCNGGTPTSNYSSSHTYDVAKNLTSNQCAKTGYVFDGWKDSNGNSYSNNQSVKNLLSANNSTITLTAQWKPLTYTIVFAANGGSGTMNSMSVTYGQVVTLTKNTFTRTGHRFDGWSGSNGTNYNDKASVSNLTTVHNSTITMTARWTKCGAGTYLANNVCTDCAVGTYSAGGVNSCTACAAGTYTNSTKSSSCTTCSAGTYNTGTGNTSCKSCETGYYCTGGANKTACAAGTYSTGGASSCTTCTVGYYCPGGSNRVACTAGTANSNTGSISSSACVSCAAGKYSGVGASSCTNCSAGTYSTGGASSCTTCTVGYYCPGGSNRVVCAAGTYTNTTGKSSCTTCSAGTYNTGTGNTSCTNCPVGYSCSGGSNKTACAAGYYSAGSASSCTICPAGSYCPGSSNKTACAAGTYTNTTGKSSCTTCSAGTYNTGTGNTTCKTCEAGYYCTGGTHKAACATGHTSSAGSSSCTKINYAVTVNVNNSSYGSVSSSSLSIPYGTTYTASGNKITFSNGTTVTATATSVTGYNTSFSGWSSTSGTITGATTITASFSRSPIYYTITTAVNNSSYGNVTSSISVAYGTTFSSSGVNITFSDGQKISASVKNATGYTTTFTSWSGGASGTVTGNKTLTANFSRRGNNYNVIYNCNGGTPTSAYSSAHVYGTASNLASNQCSKNGSTFAGWKDSSGNSYSNGQSISTLVSTDGGTITLTAQWSANTYTLTFNANGGSVSTSSKSITYGVSYGTLPTPTRSGYKFIGWYTGTASRDSSKAYKDYPWLYYADYYSDLYNAFGYNETNLANHYKTNGKSEGRRISQYISSDVFTGSSNLTVYAGWEKCSTGTYSNTANNSCDVCAAGTYSDAGAGSCTSCPKGYQCPGGTTKIACTAGTYTNATGKTSCTTCAAGTYNSGSGNTGCTTCESGYYCSGGASRVVCPKNTFSLMGQSSCTACYTGTENYGSGSTACFPKTYTLTFNANGGSVSTTSKSVTYNGDIGTLPVPTRSGYKFFGWFDGTSTAQSDSSKLYKDHPMLHYSDFNYDLKSAYGYDEAALLNHYVTYGINEAGRYVGQYRAQDKWTIDSNMTLYAGWYADKITVTINAGASETVSCTNSDSSKNFSVTTNTAGSVSKEVSSGTYSCTGSKSNYTMSASVTSSGQTINVYPPGAIFWHGNGDASGESLYAVSGGFASQDWKANGYGVENAALRYWYHESQTDYMKYYGACTQYQNGYGGTLVNNIAFSMSGYSQLTTLVTIERCYGCVNGAAGTAYSGSGTGNQMGLYAPTTRANNYENSPSNLWTDTFTKGYKSVSASSGNRYFALQLKSGYYMGYSGSSCSTTTAKIYAIYRE